MTKARSRAESKAKRQLVGRRLDQVVGLSRQNGIEQFRRSKRKYAHLKYLVE